MTFGYLSLQCVVCLKFCKIVLLYWNLKCVLILFSFLLLPSTYINNLQISADPHSQEYFDQSDIDETESFSKFERMFDGYRKMFDQSISKSKNLGVVLRFLPGVVVQKKISMQGMVDLYRINPDFVERLIKSSILIEHPIPSHCISQPIPMIPSQYILDVYLSSFLQDRDRSQLYYCDPMLQHISICRHFLSLPDGSIAFRLQS